MKQAIGLLFFFGGLITGVYGQSIPVLPSKPKQSAVTPKKNQNTSAAKASAPSAKVFYVDGFSAVKIGQQTWMQRNLDVDRFRNGDPIPEARTAEEWQRYGEQGKPAWCYYNNDPANGKIYGKLYNWYAVNDPRGLAPEGWHIPGNAEWETLIDILGGEDYGGAELKSRNYWKSNEYGATNSSGFTALPGGHRWYDGRYEQIQQAGNWWSSTESNSSFAYYRRIISSLSSFNEKDFHKSHGYSVRCIKD